MRLLVRLALVALMFHAPQAAAQQRVAFAERGPQFLLAANGSPERIEASRVPILRQRISLDLRDVSMHDAITAISRQSGLQLMFSEKILSHDRTVTLRAEAITVAAALTEVLLDAQVDVLFSRSGNAALVRRSAIASPAQVGAVTGHVTDSISREGVGGVTITVEGTRLSATTAADGGYAIRGVPAGNRSISARRLGFVRQSRAVTVADNESATVDFVLVRAPTTLSEVVTTATGEQRRVELGHVVGRINADSVVKAAPVSSLSELLTGRVPGLQVFQAQGTVGGQVNLRVRGINTIQLGTDPIVIVDGIRYTSGHASRINRPGTEFVLSSINNMEPTSPLNDLNPNEIESIEVVKGPSAATLYGTDAANGVIVITTKRGRPGPARWNAYVKSAVTEVPETRHEDMYWGWSSAFGEFSWLHNCHLQQVAQGSCTQDSVTVLRSPLNDPQLTMFGSSPRWEYGGNVAGGSQAVRYFFAGSFEEATGPVRMPPAYADSLARVRGFSKLPDEMRNPNAFSKLNLRSNVTANFGSTAQLDVSAGYSHRSTRTFPSILFANDNPYTSGAFSTIPGLPYGMTPPDEAFSRTSVEQVGRFYASTNARWSPASWLQTRATGGIDLASSARLSIDPRPDPREPGPFRQIDQINRGAITGGVADDRGRQLATTGELGAIATFILGRVTTRTAVGAQYVRTLDDVVATVGEDLPPGGSSVSQAVRVITGQTYRDQVTLGSYIEQMIGLNQRLFLTGALRVDGASTFGRDYATATYPKAGLSWLVSDEPMFPRLPGLDELRLRYAFGASSQQPRPEWARPGYALRQVFYGGTAASAFELTTLGNPNLRPERVSEHEFGFDAAAFENRLQAGLTWYRRTVSDQIVSINLPPALGTMQANLGRTTGRGFEAQMTIRPINWRTVSWDVTLLHSVQRATLVDLGGAVAQRQPWGGWVEGYAIGARFMRPFLGYEDVNGDGIIAGSEVQFGDTAVYVGESTPPRAQTVASSLRFLDGSLRVSALVERRSGFTQMNFRASRSCGALRTCRAAVDPATPLGEQARAAALGRFDYSVIEPGDFTRLREVTLAVDLPSRAVRAFRLGTATLSLQGRNLALWTSYGGSDPESAPVGPISEGSQELGIPTRSHVGVAL